MNQAFQVIAVGAAAILALIGAALGEDPLFQAHAWILFFVLVAKRTVRTVGRTRCSVAADYDQFGDVPP
jgi:cytochrome c oxidase cbb3-type subunit 1